MSIDVSRCITYSKWVLWQFRFRGHAVENILVVTCSLPLSRTTISRSTIVIVYFPFWIWWYNIMLLLNVILYVSYTSIGLPLLSTLSANSCLCHCLLESSRYLNATLCHMSGRFDLFRDQVFLSIIFYCPLVLFCSSLLSIFCLQFFTISIFVILALPFWAMNF